jgi:hypothetical protein
MPQAGTWSFGSDCSQIWRAAKPAPRREEHGQHGVDPREGAARIVDERGRGTRGHGGHGDALEHAERTRLEAFAVLQPERPSHQRRADQEAEQVGGRARRQQQQRERRHADRHHGHAIPGLQHRGARAELLQQPFLQQQREQTSRPVRGQGSAA